MAWNGSGTYNLPAAYTPEVNGTIIDATRYNGTTSDLAAGITACLAKNGENSPTANLPMGGFKHTGCAAATTSGEYVVWGQSVTFNAVTTTSISGNGSGLTSLPAGQLTGALPAISGANLTSLNASNLASGTVPDARFPSTLPAVSGANLTNLNASNLASGTVSTSRLPSSVAYLNTAQTWTAQQTPMNGTLTDGAMISWDCATQGQVVDVTLIGNRTLATPSNVQNRAIYILRVAQDATGSRTLTFSSSYKFPGNAALAPSGTASRMTVYTFIGLTSTSMQCIGYSPDLPT